MEAKRKRKTRNGYKYDSFDRFGDDLCELLLSFLSFDCKTRVSKQWKRLVFNKHKN